MADTDIKGVLLVTPSNYELEGLDKQVAYDINVLDTDFVGIETVGSHELFAVPEGKALRSLTIAVVTSADSAGDAATVAFHVGGVALATAVTEANLAEGRVVELPVLADGTIPAYAFDATAVDVEMVVAVEALTAFEFVIIPTYVDITAIVDAADIPGLQN